MTVCKVMNLIRLLTYIKLLERIIKNMILQDKVAIVTGSSRGIGAAIAEKLALAGASVIVNYSSSASHAEQVVSNITSAGGKAIAVKASVNSEEDIKMLFATAEKEFSTTADILVNNAGITRDNLLIRMKNEEFDDVIDTNVRSIFLSTRLAAIQMMKKRYGKIINISSIVGFSGNPGQFNYVASKAALTGMTKSAALELASRGIRVNAIAPGFIETDMTAALKDEFKDEYKKKIPLKSFGTANDVAEAALYLASPVSDYMTGQTLHLNGGLYL